MFRSPCAPAVFGVDRFDLRWCVVLSFLTGQIPIAADRLVRQRHSARADESPVEVPGFLQLIDLPVERVLVMLSALVPDNWFSKDICERGHVGHGKEISLRFQ